MYSFNVSKNQFPLLLETVHSLTFFNMLFTAEGPWGAWRDLAVSLVRDDVGCDIPVDGPGQVLRHACQSLVAPKPICKRFVDKVPEIMHAHSQVFLSMVVDVLCACLAQPRPRQDDSGAIVRMHVTQEVALKLMWNVLAHFKAEHPLRTRERKRYRQVEPAHKAARPFINIACGIISTVLRLRSHGQKLATILADTGPKVVEKQSMVRRGRCQHGEHSDYTAIRLHIVCTLKRWVVWQKERLIVWEIDEAYLPSRHVRRIAAFEAW